MNEKEKQEEKTKIISKKKETWIKPRHRIVTRIAAMILYPYSRLKYGIRIEKFADQKDRQYLILLNHQTPFDQFFVGIAFKGAIYYMATEDIFSNGWVSHLIRWLVNPIPIKKQTTDLAAVRTCFQVVKEGGTICIAPEGNRTYSGRTEYMNPAIAAMARKLKLPIALFRIEGGYGAEPRWSDVVRKGRMRAYVSRIIEPQEYASMTNEELFEEIRTGLFVDEASADGVFRHKKRAEYLERMVYICPYCGLSSFESQEEIVACKKCGRKLEYTQTKEIKGIGFDFPFRFAAQWYDYQKEYMNNLDTRQYTEEPFYREKARFSEVLLRKCKVCLRGEADIALYGDKIIVDEEKPNELIFSFDDITAVSVLGRNKLNIYHKKTDDTNHAEEKVYQFKGSKRFNALKYVHFYYRYKNLVRGGKDGSFLGL